MFQSSYQGPSPPVLLSHREAGRASRIWCTEIAVCESMPLPVQTSSVGLKKGGKSKYTDDWRAMVRPRWPTAVSVLGKCFWQNEPCVLQTHLRSDQREPEDL